MTKLHMVGALNQAHFQLMEQDDKIVVLGEDVGVDGGVFRVTDGLIKKFPDRVFDTPLAEAGIVATSVGMAINGLRPIAEIQFSGFSYQAFYHIKQHLARFRQRSDGTFTLPMVVRAPCAGGIHALEHHSESPESFYIHCLGVKVVMPSGPYNAKGLLAAAVKDPDPVIFLEPKSIYRSFKEEVPDELYEVPLSDANIVREGSQLTLVTWGAMLRKSMEALEQIKDVDVEVIDLRTLWPFDIDKVLQSVKKTGRAVIVQEAPKTLGLAAEIAARIQEEAMLHLEAPIIRVTAPDVPFPQYALEDYFMPNTKRIMNGIRKAMDF
ncbi:MAG: alpha-ketoacid dehydrogenase subunit beta [Nanoarchaeota archaeon]